MRITAVDRQSGTRAELVPKSPNPRQILQDALHTRGIRLVSVAMRAGVNEKAIWNAYVGITVRTCEFLRLCCALHIDPRPEIGPHRYDLSAPFPEPSSFDFGFFALAIAMRQRLNQHDAQAACSAIGIKPVTLERLKMGHVVPIGPVLRGCGYVRVHPFWYLRTAPLTNVSREYKPTAVPTINGNRRPA